MGKSSKEREGLAEPFVFCVLLFDMTLVGGKQQLLSRERYLGLRQGWKRLSQGQTEQFGLHPVSEVVGRGGRF